MTPIKYLENRFKKQWNCDYEDPDWNKISFDLEYGDHIRIYWYFPEYKTPKDELIYGLYHYIDEGYITTFPYQDGDPNMESIVHIPKPTGGEKDYPDLEWICIIDLLLDKNVIKIEKIERQNNE